MKSKKELEKGSKDKLSIFESQWIELLIDIRDILNTRLK
jgi:hypothetical protein